jgi:imidazolonepropionase-like amidohydrolase
VHAGIDCIEHGTGLTGDLVDEMARRKTALVPTLINIARFPEIAARGERYPAYAEHMRALHRTVSERVRAAYEAGVPIYAGTDAGSEVLHGRIADEVEALHGIGMTPEDALGAASWRAREWLRVGSGLEEGGLANFVIYDGDPRQLEHLRQPMLLVLRGQVRTLG